MDSNHITDVVNKLRLCLAQHFRMREDLFVIKQLGGHNNINFQVSIGKLTYFAKYANRNEDIFGSSIENEINCMVRVHDKLGISPELILYDNQESIMVTEYIKEPFDGNEFENRKKYIRSLRQLHQTSIEFKNCFFPIKNIQRYHDIAIERNIYLPSTLSRNILPKIYSYHDDQLFLERVPCHLDPQFNNVRINSKGLYFVDWEFAGMCDPFFDLASMCASEELSDSEMWEIMSLYLNCVPSDSEWQRFKKIRIIADLRMCLFCYLHTGISSPQEYKEFAKIFLRQAQQRLLPF